MTTDELSRQTLLAKMQVSWKRIMTYLKNLSMEQLSIPTDAEGWAVKDHVIHLAIWERGLLALLNKESRPEAMGISDEIFSGGWELINPIIYQNNRHLPADDVLQIFQKTHEDVVSIIEAMDDEDIQRPYRYFAPETDEERPILVWISINTYKHYDDHLPWIKAIVENYSKNSSR